MASAWCCPHQLLGLVGGLVVFLYLARKYFQGGVCRSTRRLDGKTVVITGGNSGIGKETAVELAKRGARVIIGCRDLGRGNAAFQEIRERSGNQQVFLEQLDLASLRSVRKFAENILKNEPRLDVLINNAGVGWLPFKRTEDGFEMHFGVNHLGHFLLTNLLLGLLKRSASSRVVTVSSSGHAFVSGIDLENWSKEEGYNLLTSYFWSKLANVLFSRELAKRLEGTGVTTYALHPGAIDTELGSHIPGYRTFFRFFLFPVTWIVLKTARQGAQTSIHCAVSEDVEGESGLYYSDCAAKKPSKAAQDDEFAKKLWDASMELVNL